MFGLGKSGMAAVRSLLAGGTIVYAGDDSAAVASKAGELGALTPPLGEFPWDRITSLILAPGVPLNFPKPHLAVDLARSHGVEIIGDIELLYRHYPDALYIGITGTNGKSTTTALTYHILKESGLDVQVGGNLGTPALELKAPGKGARGIYVLEVSSYQAELMDKCRFNIAALLNITPDHIDRHGSMLGYINAKKSLFDKQEADDYGLISVDDKFSGGIYEYLSKFEKRDNVIPVSIQGQMGGGLFAHEASVFDALERNHIYEYEITSALALKGTHNWQNACFAVGMARLTAELLEGGKPDNDNIYKGLYSFPGLPHRMEQVGQWQGITFINDSKATNANAAERALSTFKNIYWIAGGRMKEGGIESLEPLFGRIIKAYLVGEAEEQFAKTLEGKLEYEKCGHLQTAFIKATDDALVSGLKDTVILLSPACASLDQWPNFEARGDAFKAMAGDWVSGR